MRRSRKVIGYHACSAEVATRLVAGEAFIPSENAWDWLGSGIYFFEESLRRAQQWAEEQAVAGRFAEPAVVAVQFRLGHCFDLADAGYAEALEDIYPAWRAQMERRGQRIPVNRRRRHDLDCAVVNFALSEAAEGGIRYDTVRGLFLEGEPTYPGSEFKRQTHVQVCVRNQDVLGRRVIAWKGAKESQQ